MDVPEAEQERKKAVENVPPGGIRVKREPMDPNIPRPAPDIFPPPSIKPEPTDAPIPKLPPPHGRFDHSFAGFDPDLKPAVIKQEHEDLNSRQLYPSSPVYPRVPLPRVKKEESGEFSNTNSGKRLDPSPSVYPRVPVPRVKEEPGESSNTNSGKRFDPSSSVYPRVPLPQVKKEGEYGGSWNANGESRTYTPMIKYESVADRGYVKREEMEWKRGHQPEPPSAFPRDSGSRGRSSRPPESQYGGYSGSMADYRREPSRTHSPSPRPVKRERDGYRDDLREPPIKRERVEDGNKTENRNMRDPRVRAQIEREERMRSAS
ncbi:hypothetical protein B0H16DRAFT_235712 [Mycena metata]|uniref:Uncharacterized protein n=1 Tax=Mycena metata TaxID=1033252 RepID=A0AAD7NPR9_9AGAR|nr:hypothetical protein B0H16DRAFT_235712 [Mycena metata]